MRKSVKLCFTALTAAGLLASVVATTSARNLSVSNQNIRVAWALLDFGSPLVTIRCPVTLEGSLHSRTIVKRVGTLIGYITAAIVRRGGSCRNGEAWSANGVETHPRLGRLANTLPWHITYEGFVGTLPNITQILVLLRGARFKVHTIFDTLCLFGKPEDNITGRLIRDPATRAITGLEPVEPRNRATLVEELGESTLCPAQGTFANERPGVVTLLGNTTRITVTLI